MKTLNFKWSEIYDVTAYDEEYGNGEFEVAAKAVVPLLSEGVEILSALPIDVADMLIATLNVDIAETTVLTCGCGHAGCAGIWTSWSITKRPDGKYLFEYIEDEDYDDDTKVIEIVGGKSFIVDIEKELKYLSEYYNEHLIGVHHNDRYNHSTKPPVPFGEYLDIIAGFYGESAPHNF